MMLRDATFSKTSLRGKKSVLVLLHKKGSDMECSNYRTIALTSHLSKVLMMIITERLRSQIEEHMADEQAGFRKDRSREGNGCVIGLGG